MRANRITFGGLLGVAVAAVIVITATLSNSAQREIAESKTERELLVERNSVLEQIVQLNRDAYRTGDKGFSSVGHAHAELLESQLALAAVADDRMVVLRDMVQLAVQLEKMAQQRFQAGGATQLDVLESRAVRLKFEAQLAQETCREQT